MIVSGIPKAAEKAMENFKEYVICGAPIAYHKELVAIQDPLERNDGIRGPR